MTKFFRITNPTSGADLGIYYGETGEDAIAAMLADAGCDEPADPDLVATEEADPPEVLESIHETRQHLAGRLAQHHVHHAVSTRRVDLDALALADEIVEARRGRHAARMGRSLDYRVKSGRVRQAIAQALASTGYDVEEFLSTIRP